MVPLDTRADFRGWSAWQLVDDRQAMPARLYRFGQALGSLGDTDQTVRRIAALSLPTVAFKRRFGLTKGESKLRVERALQRLQAALQAGAAPPASN